MEGTGKGGDGMVGRWAAQFCRQLPTKHTETNENGYEIDYCKSDANGVERGDQRRLRTAK